jgi:hypothetical protein
MSQCPGRSTATAIAASTGISSAATTALLLGSLLSFASPSPAQQPSQTPSAQPQGQPQDAPQTQTCYKDEAGRIVTRRRPGYVEVPCPPRGSRNVQPGVGAPTGPPAQGGTGTTAGESLTQEVAPTVVSPVPRPAMQDFPQSVAVPDRWRIVDALGYPRNYFDPYNQNTLKADKPVFGGNWFFDLGLLSDTVYQAQNVVTPVGSVSTVNAGSNDVFGGERQQVFAQSAEVDLTLFRGDTVFKPPDYQFKVSGVFNYNYVKTEDLSAINIDPREGPTRSDNFTGLQAAFAEMRLREVSEKFDFDSIRVGIQPFSTDFRGFLFQDDQLGVRLFGTRDNNLYQYNIAYFRLIEKDTNSGLNDIGAPLRKDDVFVFNLFSQDTPVDGFTSQVTVVYNRDREGDQIHFNTDGFIVRPSQLGLERARDYDVVYLGYNGDGHFGAWNLTTSFYWALGTDRQGTFIAQNERVDAQFFALELSHDFDWVRPRLSVLYGSGDRNPYGKDETGFDAIRDNPQFAGADSSYWIRQAVPLVGGGGVSLAGGNNILNNLRSSQDEGQSNFANPGIALAGVGADFDLLTQLRVSVNANSLFFVDPEVVAVARNQAFDQRYIGQDVDVSLIFRPLDTQNIVLRTSYAQLFTGGASEALFPKKNPAYFLFNLILAY